MQEIYEKVKEIKRKMFKNGYRGISKIKITWIDEKITSIILNDISMDDAYGYVETMENGDRYLVGDYTIETLMKFENFTDEDTEEDTDEEEKLANALSNLTITTYTP